MVSVATRPKCPLCGVELKHETELDKDGKEVIVEPHVGIFIHNPKGLHEDIRVQVHKTCHVKVVALYPNYALPTQADWAAPKLPSIQPNGSVILKNLTAALLEK